MPRKSNKPSPTQADFKHTWYLREWMEQSLPPKRQTDMVRDLNWSKAVASAVHNGQQYTQTLIDQLAPWLNVKPWELLMPPKEAMAIRALRKSAAEIVSSDAPGAEAREQTTRRRA